MPNHEDPDIVLVTESAFFHPKSTSFIDHPMTWYSLEPLTRLNFPYIYHFPAQPQLGIVLLATYLRRRGFKVLVFDNVFRLAEQRDKFFAALKRHPAAVGISTTFMSSAGAIADIAGWVRTHAPGAKIVLGGIGALKNQFAHDYGDFIVAGVGEQTLADLLTALTRRQPWDGISNLCWRDNAGQWRATERRANFSITQRPAPDWDMLDLRPQLCYGIESSRGCPHACAFCDFPNAANQQPVTLRPIDEVVAELRKNREQYGLESFYFTDSNFTSHPERAAALCRAIMDAGLRIQWRCYGRADDFIRLPTLAKTMQEAGCVVVALGLESGSDELLKRMRKDCTRAQMQEGLGIAKAGGLLIHGSFIIGFPGETPATVAETLDFIRNSDIDSVYFHILSVTDQLRDDAERREDRHLHIVGKWQSWSHDGMCSHEAARLCAHCIDVISTTMERPLLTSFPIYGMYGLNLEESIALQHAFRAYRRAAKDGDQTRLEAAQEQIRSLYSKIMACYPPITACDGPDGDLFAPDWINVADALQPHA